MKNYRKKMICLMTPCILLSMLLLGIVVCIIIANSRNDGSAPNERLAEWQDMIEDDTLLKEIAITGAHDAGTKGMPYYVKTQDRSVADLLSCGTRYFDLRVSYSDGRLRIYHGPSKGAELGGILDDIRVFMNVHPSEALILDFQHFEGDGVQPQTIELVEEKLAGLFVRNDTSLTDTAFVDALTLGQMRGKAFVVWGRENEEILSKNYVFKRNNDDGTRESCVIHSYYQTSLNTMSSAKYIDQALPQYIEAYKNVRSGLFVLQGQLTDGAFVFGPHLREATHTDNMNEYVESLRQSGDLNLINIVLRDFVSPKKNCLTLQLNVAKGIVKYDRLAEFNDMLQAHLG